MQEPLPTQEITEATGWLHYVLWTLLGFIGAGISVGVKMQRGEQLAGALQQEIHQLDPRVEIWATLPMTEFVKAAFLAPALASRLLSWLGFVALALEAAGQLGVEVVEHRVGAHPRGRHVVCDRGFDLCRARCADFVQSSAGFARYAGSAACAFATATYFSAQRRRPDCSSAVSARTTFAGAP